MNNNEKLSIARMFYPVNTLGPGNRVGIWTNGCKRHCTDCISPELQRYDESKEYSSDEILSLINRIEKPIEGFTISGGEPFLKPVALAKLVLKLTEINDDIILFTGYTLTELKLLENPDVNTVIENCSVIVDGPYIQELNDNTGLRGSSNQRIWVFKHKEKYQDIDTMPRHLQTVVYGNGILTIGIPGGKKND